MPRRNEASFDFWYDEKWYSVQGAETMARIGTKDDMATMRSEYTRMRDTAQKRLQRLAKQFPESKAVQSHPHGFKKLKELDPRDFPKAFAELAKFLKAKGSTVSGQRSIKQKTIDTWQQQGLNLNSQNYDQAIRILEEMRKQKITYGSDKVVELADTMMELDDQQTRRFLDKLDTLIQHTQELNMWVDVMQARGDAVDIDELIKELGW